MWHRLITFHRIFTTNKTILDSSGRVVPSGATLLTILDRWRGALPRTAPQFTEQPTSRTICVSDNTSDDLRPRGKLGQDQSSDKKLGTKPPRKTPRRGQRTQGGRSPAGERAKRGLHSLGSLRYQSSFCRGVFRDWNNCPNNLQLSTERSS